MPRTLFSHHHHAAVQARASTATARPGAAAGARRPQSGAAWHSRRSRGWGRHFADMERDGIYAGEVRRLRAEKQHRLGR